MQVVTNGKQRKIDDGTTVEALIMALGLFPGSVIVERNGEPVERKRYGDVRLAEGDRLELVRAVAGG